MHEGPRPSRLPVLVLLFGKLEVESRIEFVDHAIPGIILMAVAVLCVIQVRAAKPRPILLFASGGAIMLAGFWMVSTHVGLLSELREGRVCPRRGPPRGAPRTVGRDRYQGGE